MKRHVMLDLETLGTKPGCPIVAIGATCFLNAPEAKRYMFYCTITPESQEDLMDPPDAETMVWWHKQSEEARVEVFNNPASIDIVKALHEFKQFLQQLQVTTEDEIVIWGKGATFDEPVLAEAYKRAVIPVQWTFRNSLCHRTLETIGRMFNIEEPKFAGTKHHALADAIHQAKYAKAIIDIVGTALEESLK